MIDFNAVSVYRTVLIEEGKIKSERSVDYFDKKPCWLISYWRDNHARRGYWELLWILRQASNDQP